MRWAEGVACSVLGFNTWYAEKALKAMDGRLGTSAGKRTHIYALHLGREKFKGHLNLGEGDKTVRGMEDIDITVRMVGIDYNWGGVRKL